MGDAGGQGLPALPPGNWVGYSGQVLPDHEQVGLASACIAEADRGRPTPAESLEYTGRQHHLS